MTNSPVPNGGSVTKLEERVSAVLPVTAGAKVYCVVCIADTTAHGLRQVEGDVVHIFSTQEKSIAFCNADAARGHVLYDYVIDCPERMEGRAQ